MVISNAGNLASDIHSLSASLVQASGDVESQIGSTVTQINQLASTIQQYNVDGCSRVPRPRVRRQPALRARPTFRAGGCQRGEPGGRHRHRVDERRVAARDGHQPILDFERPVGFERRRQPAVASLRPDSGLTGQRHHQPDSRRATGRLAGCAQQRAGVAGGRWPAGRVAQPVREGLRRYREWRPRIRHGFHGFRRRQWRPAIRLRQFRPHAGRGQFRLEPGDYARSTGPGPRPGERQRQRQPVGIPASSTSAAA